MRHGFVLLSLAVLLAACSGNDEPEDMPVPEPLAFESILSGSTSGAEVEAASVFAIRDAGEWEEFWSRHEAAMIPPSSPPEFGFDDEMLIAVVDRQQPSGGYILEVSALHDRGSVIEVLAERLEPGPSCVVTLALTRPFDIVRAPASDLPLELNLISTMYDC